MSGTLSKTHAEPLAADCHFHVFAAHSGVPGARYRPAYDAPLASWQALAGAQGIGRGVLVQTSFMGADNRALLQALDAAQGALRGVAVLEPSASAADVAALHARGVRGIRLNLAGTRHDMAPWGAAAGALWDALHAHGWHVQIHTDDGALPQVLQQLPADLPLVLDHFARPLQASVQDATVRVLAARAAHSPVHIKLSAAYRLAGLDARALAQLWLAELGPHRLLWGSDWPCTNYEAQADYPALMAAVRSWIDDPAVLHEVLVTNPSRLYWR